MANSVWVVRCFGFAFVIFQRWTTIVCGHNVHQSLIEFFLLFVILGTWMWIASIHARGMPNIRFLLLHFLGFFTRQTKFSLSFFIFYFQSTAFALENRFSMRKLKNLLKWDRLSPYISNGFVDGYLTGSQFDKNKA